MADHNLRSALLNKDKQSCYHIVSSNLIGESLIGAIYEMLFASASVIYEGKLILHPVCVINSIKNFIGDDRVNPSRPLMRFAIDYLLEFQYRSNDEDNLDEVLKNGIGQTVFVGELEDACQTSDWQKAETIMSKTFLASDRSRATLDMLVELALQSAPRNAVFIYHLLRGYQFQENKIDNWAFIKCVFNQIKLQGLDNAHSSVNITPDNVKQSIIKTGDIVYFSAIENIWNGEYIRMRGYRRELSYWLSKIKLNEPVTNELTDSHFLKDNENSSFIIFAEKIINKEKTQNEKAQDLVILNAVRSICKNIDQKGISRMGSRFNHLVSR